MSLSREPCRFIHSNMGICQVACTIPLMKKIPLLLLLVILVSPLVAGQTHTPGESGPDPANIPVPTAAPPPPGVVPMLPFHFGTRPVPPLNQKFGNVAAVAFTP